MDIFSNEIDFMRLFVKERTKYLRVVNNVNIFVLHSAEEIGLHKKIITSFFIIRRQTMLYTANF